MTNKNNSESFDPILDVLNNEKVVTDAIKAGITDSLKKHRLLGHPIWADENHTKSGNKMFPHSFPLSGFLCAKNKLSFCLNRHAYVFFSP